MLKRQNLFQVLHKFVDSERKKTDSTQDLLNYRKMFSNGICKVTDNTYSKMLQFSDISYQLSQDEMKQKIFAQYSALLNSFDQSVEIQLCFINYRMQAEKTETVFVETSSNESEKKDSKIQALKKEYLSFVDEQREKGNNGILRNKYFLITVKDKSYGNAARRLENIEVTVRENFKMMGSMTEALNGIERLSVINYLLNGDDPSYVDLETLSKGDIGQATTKDIIAPRTTDFESSKTEFKVNRKFGATLNFRITATELSDRVLADFLDLDLEQLVSMHIRVMDQQKAVKMVKTKKSDLDKIKIEEQKKALRSGYDMDILPTDLNSNVKESEKILKDLQRENEKYFFLTFTVTVFEKSQKELDNSIFRVMSVAQKQNCTLVKMTFQQEKALISALPLGVNINEVEAERGLTTSSTAIFVPFTTQELYQNNQWAVYYGLNALSNNMIQASRKNLKNPNGLYLGTPGSGKTFAVKREIVDTYVKTNDDIIISDPEGEYFYFVQLLGGEEIKISTSSTNYINPMDISENYGEGDNPVSFKSDFVMDLMQVIAGGKNGLSARDKTLTDKCVRTIYRTYIQDPKPENMPILEDLYNEYRKSDHGQELADALELYVHGSLNVFNNRTNVDAKNRLICFNIKELGSNLKDLGQLIVQDHVWNKVTQNRNLGKKTWYYMDEFHRLLAEEQTSNYSVEFWKRFRKWGGIPTGITQNVKDLLSSPKIETILDNSDFIYLLNQSSGDRKILQERLEISDYQANYITNSNEGEGLLVYSGVILPFKDKFPKNNSLYPVMTSKPDEIAKYRKEGVYA
jgi:type IV secretory pathway VirB4 component